MKIKSLPWIMILLFILNFTLTSCTPKSLAKYKRDESFFGPFINNSSNYIKASEELAGLKLLATGEEFPIRVVLFDNGIFYYQVDKLGDGEGNWEYKNGALSLTAPRKFFDIEFLISAASVDGNNTKIEFFDRFGYNSLSIQFRDPITAAGVRANSENENLLPLRTFVGSNKGL